MSTRKRILRYSELPNITGLSEMTIRRLIDKDDFVRPCRLSANAVGFDSDAVDRWIDARIAASAQSGRQA